jgi:hypothetical protein
MRRVQFVNEITSSELLRIIALAALLAAAQAAGLDVIDLVTALLGG